MAIKKTEKDDMIKSKIQEYAKKYGAGSVMLLGERPQVQEEVLSTGSLKLDKALGVGGLPFGRIVEIYGPESSGKTTLTLHVIAEAQAKGKTCLFIDVEQAFDAKYAKALGVDVDQLILAQPSSAEEALEIANGFAQSAAIDVIVLDSVAALVPSAELEGDMGDSHMGLQARLMAQALRKLTPVIKQNNCLMIFINQIRQKIGVTYGSNETTTGGNSLKFYASVRLDIRRVQSIKKGEDVVANEVKIKTVKNKVAPPFKEIKTMIYFGRGFDKTAETLDIAESIGLVKRSGAWYSKNEDGNVEKIAQGKEKALEYLKQPENKEYLDHLIKKVTEYLLNSNSEISDGEPEDEVTEDQLED